MPRRRAVLLAALFGLPPALLACEALLDLRDPAPYAEPGADGGVLLDDAGRPVLEDGALLIPAGDAGLEEQAPVTCVADLETDEKNCGRCGHDCLGTNCGGGMCQPKPIAVGLLEDAQLVARGGSLYYPKGSDVYAFDEETNVIRPFRAADAAASPAVSGLAVDVTRAYFAFQGPTLRWCPTAGCSTVPGVVSGNADDAFSLAPFQVAGAPYALVWVTESNTVVHAVTAIEKATLATVPGISAAPRQCSRLATTAGHVFVNDRAESRIRSISSEGVERAARGLPRPACALVADGDRLFFSDANEILGAAIRGDGSLETPVRLAGGQPGTLAMAMDADHVYWAPKAPGASLVRCKRSGCNLRPEPMMLNAGDVRGLAVGTRWLFFHRVSGDGQRTLFKVAK